MPVKALKFKSGVRREGTSYSHEGSWYDCSLVRFRQGLPEKIGGWQRISSASYLGTCRLLFPWTTLEGNTYVATGTNLKFYVQNGGLYYDITPIRSTVTLNNPFDTTNLSTTVTVHDTAHGALTNDFVTFSGASAVGGLDLNGEYQITKVDDDTYTITAASAATSTVTGGGGATVSAEYQLNTGPEDPVPYSGWGAGPWGSGTWGVGTSTTNPLQIWNVAAFGEDLVFGPRGAAPYYWTTSSGLTSNRGVALSTLSGASDTPTLQNFIVVSDVSRFVLVLGTNEIGSADMDPMLIRWSDQESAANWTPGNTTKAGSLRLSKGSKIVSAVQTRQEILVFTDTAVYSLQYVNAPAYWGATLLGDNVSIMSGRSAAYASNVVYWMGVGKFYMYDGRVQVLSCDVLQYVFDDFNFEQYDQVFSGTIAEFDEIWWFYCTAESEDVDSYVVFNYAEGTWYFGSLNRTAWCDAGVFDYPIAANQEDNNLLFHEYGTDSDTNGTPTGISAYVESAQFDLDDGDRFALVTKVIPDITFRNSSAVSPAVTLTLKALKNSGSGYNDPASVGGDSTGTVTRTATSPIEAYTDQVYLRIRGRQLVFRIESSALGVTWQLGVPRIDVRPDGRRG